jgi:hypothetical protein
MAAMRNKRMNANHKEMVAELEPKNDEGMLACQEMEVRPEGKKPTSLDRKPEAAQKEENQRRKGARTEKRPRSAAAR